MTLLMRTADKTGAFGVVRATARAQRRAAASSPTGEPSAHALFASAYVFAKYYWPQRALPLLERARSKAEHEQNWELEHACRDGIGAVLKQLGRYAESIEQIGCGLALARRTLNPQAEATSLVNIAVAQMAMGQFEAAAHHLELSAHIDNHFPRWPYRVYRHVNQGVLALLTDHIGDAVTAFERGLELATAVGLRPIGANCYAGLGLCALRMGDLVTLSERCECLHQLMGRHPWIFADRWMVEAAFAWNRLLNLHEPELALAHLSLASRELSRRDVDHWLRIRMEFIDLSERITGRVEAEERRKLTKLASHYQAMAIVAAAAIERRKKVPAVRA
jgi:tetratricopeptide (TPR) repeat protein